MPSPNCAALRAEPESMIRPWTSEAIIVKKRRPGDSMGEW